MFLVGKSRSNEFCKVLLGKYIWYMYQLIQYILHILDHKERILILMEDIRQGIEYRFHHLIRTIHLEHHT